MPNDSKTDIAQPGSLHPAGSADWSPMLRTSELQFSLYSDGTFEIRDGGAVYVHLTEEETTQMLKWLDGRNPPNSVIGETGAKPDDAKASK